MRRTRGGSDVREFCGYYVLELLRGGEHLTRDELIGAIAEAGAGNRAFRPSGVLKVPAAEMWRALEALEATGQVKAAAPRGKPGEERRASGGRRRVQAGIRWRITRRGRRTRKELVEQAEKHSGDKDRAARKLMSLVGKPKRPGWALDVGTGQGFLAFKLARRGFRVLGVDSGEFDYSKESVEKARQRARSFGGQVEFCQADVIRVPEGACGGQLPRRFALVTASQAIHCMRDQCGCLATIFTLLRSGGRFLALDFSVGVRGFLAHGFHCFLAPTRLEWVELLGSAGFRDPAFHDAGDYLVVEARKPRRHSQLLPWPAGEGRGGQGCS